MDDRKDSRSIRIYEDTYELIKDRAKSNNRNIAAELDLVVKEFCSRDVPVNRQKKLEALKGMSGLINDLPPGNHSETVDEVLYGDSYK